MKTKTRGNSTRGVAITGIGVISSFGDDVSRMFQAIWNGDDAFVEVRRRSEPWHRASRAALVQGFDPRRFIPPMKLRRLDQCSAFTLAASELAFGDAGLLDEKGQVREEERENLSRGGVVLGTGTSGSGPVAEYLAGLLVEGGEGQFPMIFPNTVPNAPAGQVSIRFGLRGPNMTISQKENSGLLALADAADFISSGRCEIVLTGGVDSYTEELFAVFDRLRFLSPGKSGGEEKSRPFDARRNGWMVGDGAYMLLLESEDRVRRRGAAVHGRILGSGHSSSPCPTYLWPDEPGGFEQCMTNALSACGLEPRQIGAVLASANGNIRLDRSEARALETLFCRKSSLMPPVTALKSVLGECGAMGAAHAITALACFSRKSVPPTQNVIRHEMSGGFDLVIDDPRQFEGSSQAVLINSFSSGGSNVSLVLAPPARHTE